ncbi:hypothetical protein MMC19_007526 [Ptychographa xylographoides]|nr:hypothetical protein [Ptychographa xylographoides]
MDSIRVAAPALITAAPSLGRHELRKRQSQTLDPGQVCGYISGDPARHATTVEHRVTGAAVIVSPAGGRPIARTRVHHTVVISARRIARIVKSSNGAANSSALLGSDSRADAVLSSDPASPACITFVRETTVGDSNKFTSWGCAPTSTIFTALEGVTGGSGGGGSFPLSSSTSGSLTGSSSSPTTTSANSPSNTNNNYDPLSKPAEIGTIVGTVLAFIAIVISIYYGQKRIRDHRNAAQNP